MRRRTQTPINFWKCGHFSPVVIEEAEGGKSPAVCCAGARTGARGVGRSLRHAEGSGASA